MKRSGILVSGVLLLVFMVGCAVHNPMSETVMFKDEPAMGGKENGLEVNTGIGITSDIYPQGQKAPGKPDNVSVEQLSQASTQAYFMISPANRNNFALSIALNPFPGLDATFKLSGKTYLTASVTDLTDPGTQIILQRRLIFRDPLGLSLGVSFQRTNHYISNTYPDCIFCIPDESFFTNSIGLRSALIFKPLTYFGKGNQAIYFNGSVNYDITVEAVFVRMGLSIVIF